MTSTPEPDGPGTEPAPPSSGAPPADTGAPVRWPWWIAVAACGAVILLQQTVVLVLGIGLLANGASLERPPPGVTLVLGFALSAVLIATALTVPLLIARPRARDFALRRTRIGPAVGFSALAMGAFLGFGAFYQHFVREDVKQSTLEDLGVGRGTGALIAGGVLIVVLAPIGEELFFRGLLYRSLRSRLSIPVAAIVAGALFGLPHASTGIAAVPPLALLGVVFCLVVERTGSLFPTIALHAINNAFAYSISKEAPAGAFAVALPLLAAMLAVCLLVPRRLDRAEPARGAAQTPVPG